MTRSGVRDEQARADGDDRQRCAPNAAVATPRDVTRHCVEPILRTGAVHPRRQQRSDGDQNRSWYSRPVEPTADVAHSRRKRCNTRDSESDSEHDDEPPGPFDTPSHELTEHERKKRTGKRSQRDKRTPTTGGGKHAATGQTRCSLSNELHGDAPQQPHRQPHTFRSRLVHTPIMTAANRIWAVWNCSFAASTRAQIPCARP
jgi:hypothetical protein